MKNEILEKILESRKNLIVDGLVSSGKTINVLSPLVSEFIKNEESMFILDSKKEYLNEYYQALKENNYNVVIINLRELDKSEGFNPLEYPYNLYKMGRTDDAQEYIEKIGKTLFYQESSIDPFWISTARNLFEGICLSLFEDGKTDEINLNSVYNILLSGTEKSGENDLLSKYFETKKNKSFAYNLASPTTLAPIETKGGILSVAKQKLGLYVSRVELSNFLNKTTFNLEDILNKKTAVIFINKDESKSLNAIASIFIEELYYVLISNGVNNRFNFVLDNFDSLLNLEEFNEMLGSCISRNIKFYIGTRSVDNIIINYGEYIVKLCDLISIVDNKMKLNLDEEVSIDKKELKSGGNFNIEYPKLKNTKISIFDIHEYLNNNVK